MNFKVGYKWIMNVLDEEVRKAGKLCDFFCFNNTASNAMMTVLRLIKIEPNCGIK